jgi:outer membrane immunogenic protein
MLKLRSGILGLTLASVVALAAGSANAADMYRGEAGGYKDAPVYAPVTSWTGFYAGLNAGYGWSADNGSDTPAGGFGGGQIGYNWQGGLGLGHHVVLGVEADLQASAISGTQVRESDLNYFGTVRGRIGYAFDRTLVYATGGFAYGQVENKPVSETQTGYVLGGGIEYKFNPSWSLKAEYQFLSLDASDVNGAGSLGFSNSDRSEVHTVRAGINYHVGHGYEPLK